MNAARHEPRGLRLTAAAAVLAAAALALAWPLAAPGAEADEAPPAGERVRLGDDKAADEYDLYRLPDGCRLPDGSFSELAIVGHQKRRLETINARLGTRLRAAETPHFLFFSDADGRTTARFTAWGEALYDSLREQFGLPKRERVWHGKCVVLLFRNRAEFDAYARTFDRHDAAQAGAYFAVEGHGPDGPQLVHMCFPLDRRDERRLQELFAHEGTHAFFELYRAPGRLPLWLHEGLAEYMTTVNDRALRASKWPAAARAARSPASLQRLFAREAGEEMTLDEYAVAFTLVDFLLDAGRERFKQFVDALKDGRPQNAALAAAYGFDLRELEVRWREHALRRGPPEGR